MTELADEVLALVRAVLDASTPHRPQQREQSEVASLAYERVVERPRKAGIDPVFRSLMAEATAEHIDPIDPPETYRATA